MTSSNGDIFRVPGHLCGEITGPPWIPRTKVSDAELWCFLSSCVWMNGWVNNRGAGDLRRNRAHYDVIVMEIRFTHTHTWWKHDWNPVKYIFVLILIQPVHRFTMLRQLSDLLDHGFSSKSDILKCFDCELRSPPPPPPPHPWSDGRAAELTDGLLGWLFCWLVGWLVGYLSGWSLLTYFSHLIIGV